jgi:hypothetical protein
MDLDTLPINHNRVGVVRGERNGPLWAAFSLQQDPRLARAHQDQKLMRAEGFVETAKQAAGEPDTQDVHTSRDEGYEGD